jgi:hypothetical protein
MYCERIAALEPHFYDFLCVLGQYNDLILALPPRINAKLEKRETIKK